jgi:hypothetical protein
MAVKYTINDYRNFFGTLKSGQLTAENALYTGPGNNPYAYTERNKAEGGEIGIPYFAEFRLEDDVTLAKGPASLIVEGAPDNASQAPDADMNAAPAAPTAGWQTVGSLVIPKGAWESVVPYRVAFSDSKYKWFRARLELTSGDTGAPVLTAFLHRA